MKRRFLILLTFLTLTQVNSQTSIFNNLLQKHVSNDGFVDYKSFKKDLPKLKKYISYLEKSVSNNSWSVNKQKAFWINVYNAHTILLILHEYPIKSIMDIKIKGKSAWKTPFVKIGEKTYTLDFIEHEILRKKLFDPKIHVGVNCASISCPKLSNIAFTEENIETELTRLMKEFINDSNRNKISENKLQVSEIFNWFKNDFTKNGSLINYLNKYSKTKIKPKAKVGYLKYNWSLNSK